jgi:hypothetical protein
MIPSSNLISAAVSPSEAVATIEGPVRDTIVWATDWGISAGFLMLGIVLFYQVVILIVRPDK